MFASALIVGTCAVLSGVLAAPVADARAGPITGPNYAAHLAMLENMNATAFEEDAELVRRGGTPSSTGYNNGYYYSFYTDNQAYVIYTNGAGGQYSVQWSGNGDFVAGKGWNPGSYTSISYSGTYGPNPAAGSYLALYGWTTNPLIEYYIVDNFAAYNPSTGAQYKGTCSSDGSTYNVYQDQRTNEPSILGTSTFQQYWSVRQNTRTGGTINIGQHFSCWRNYGMNLGTYNYQIMAVEGFSQSGTATITVGGR